MIYEKEFIIDGCIHRCPLFSLEGNIMVCTHPHFDDKPSYDNYIITNDIGHSFPKECPLKREKKTTIIKKYKLKE